MLQFVALCCRLLHFTSNSQASQTNRSLLVFLIPRLRNPGLRIGTERIILRDRDAWQGIPSMSGGRKMLTAAVIHRSDKVPLQAHR